MRILCVTVLVYFLVFSFVVCVSALHPVRRQHPHHLRQTDRTVLADFDGPNADATEPRDERAAEPLEEQFFHELSPSPDEKDEDSAAKELSLEAEDGGEEAQPNVPMRKPRVMLGSPLERLRVLLANYDPTVPPLVVEEREDGSVEVVPVRVTSTYVIRRLAKIDEQTESFEVQLLLSYHWFDSRLANLSSSDLFPLETGFVQLDGPRAAEFATLLWTPRLFPAGLLQPIDVLEQQLRIYSNDHSKPYNIMRTVLTRISVSSPMDFSNYPFDSNELVLSLQSIHSASLVQFDVQPEHVWVRIPGQAIGDLSLNKKKPIQVEIRKHHFSAGFDSADAVWTVRISLHVQRAFRSGFFNNIFWMSLPILLCWASFLFNVFESPHNLRYNLATTGFFMVFVQCRSVLSAVPPMSEISFLHHIVAGVLWFCGCSVLSTIFPHLIQYYHDERFIGAYLEKPHHIGDDTPGKKTAMVVDSYVRWCFSLLFLVFLVGTFVWLHLAHPSLFEPAYDDQFQNSHRCCLYVNAAGDRAQYDI